MLIALLISAALSSEPNDVPGFAQFQMSRSLIYITETVDIAAYRDERLNRLEYKIRYNWSQQFSPRKIDAVINSTDCPAIHQIVTRMGKLQMPQPLPIVDSELPPPPIMDGNYYELTAPSSFGNGHLTITSNGGTPLAIWVEHALAALLPCLPSTPLP
ncbi:hypothetical protein [Sphingomonas glacialis]|uniref:Uncharacterized protein n=1 Tax=Sphingomonas glacialis TaxID=658225 RepID=A0A502FRV9_9SPHN|nr:hypothetical protein [Sphingomonas glacialis]TPG52195.1 hypothetical protein EAH76_15985 [Sphingomonas glacialis]